MDSEGRVVGWTSWPNDDGGLRTGLLLMHFMAMVLIAFTDNIALLSFVIYYFMMITIPPAVLIRPHGLLCIDSIKSSVFHWVRTA